MISQPVKIKCKISPIIAVGAYIVNNSCIVTDILYSLIYKLKSDQKYNLILIKDNNNLIMRIKFEVPPTT